MFKENKDKLKKYQKTIVKQKNQHKIERPISIDKVDIKESYRLHEKISAI